MSNHKANNSSAIKLTYLPNMKLNYFVTPANKCTQKYYAQFAHSQDRNG